MKWKEFSVVTEENCVEAIAAIFHNMGSGGVIIEEPRLDDLPKNPENCADDCLAPDYIKHDSVIVKAYFPENREIIEELEEFLLTVRNTFNAPCQVLVNEVCDEDWEESWKKYYHTFKIGKRLVIKPSWEEYTAQEDEVLIDIDPGMAFGTGSHASTRFCLNFIDQYVKGGEKIIDAGCGSGILSIAAAKLGAATVFAMDFDDVAGRIARDNVKLNTLENIIQVEVGNIIEDLPQMEVDYILANITAEVVNLLIPEAVKLIRPGGYMFCSGIIESRWPDVQKQLEDHGLAIEKLLKESEWVGVAARKL